MPVTQKEIALKLKLSQSLVAGVLNNRSGVWVSEENRERILSTAKEMNYRPHAAARALRRGKTEVVACVFCGKAEGNTIGETLANCLAKIGYDLLVTVIPEQAQVKNRLEKVLSPGACDAIVLWGSEELVIEPVELIRDAGIPFVVKGRHEDTYPEWVQVDFDHEGMMEDSVAHLKNLGHHRVAYFGYNSGSVYEGKLLNGFKQSILRHTGKPVETDLIRFLTTETSVEEHLHEWSLLSPELRPTAFVVGTGLEAWHVVEIWLASQGKRLRDAKGEFSMSGQGDGSRSLLYAEEVLFHNVEQTLLAEVIGNKILPTLLAGKTPDANVHLILPPMQTYKSMNLKLPA